MNIPKLRFKADDGENYPDWELSSVDKKFKFIVTKNKDLSITNVITNSAEFGLLPQRDFFKKDIANKDNIDEYYIIHKGDFVYNPRKSANAPFGPFNLYEIDEPGIVSPLYTCLTPLNKEWATYLSYYFQSNRWHNYVTTHGGKGARQGRVNMSKALMKGIPISMPTIAEQRKISNFLSAVDDVIAKQQAEVATWEQYKKGVAQKLFNQEVRFKADDGSDFPAWDSMNFGNVFEEISNNTLARVKLSDESGQAKNIHYGDIHTKFGEILDLKEDAVPFIIPEVDCSRMMPLQDGDIVIADTAEDNTVGKAVEVHNVGSNILYAGLHTIARRPKFKFAPKYLGYYINSNAYHDQLIPYMQGTKLPAISKAHILLTHIAIPSPQEQRKIAECLDAINDVIALSKAELEKWRELKQGLLQQLFV